MALVSRIMFNYFKSSASKNIIGVEFKQTGVSIVETVNNNKSPGLIKRANFIECTGQQAQTDALNDWVKSNKAEKTLCNCVIGQDDYQVNPIERPEVPDEEMEEAIKWKVKDLVSFDINAAVIDHYPIPESSKNPIKQINAVITNEASIEAYVEVLRQSGVKLNVLDIRELVIGNIFQYFEAPAEIIGFLVLRETDGQLYIIKDGNIYVERDFKIGLRQIDHADNTDMYDAVVLEIQRSVDYFESYFGVGTIQELLIFPQTQAVEKMAMYLQNYVNFSVDFFGVQNINELNDSEAFDVQCFTAYCASLRT